ncbi:MAG: hypothetical protein LUF28_08940 [Clostridiales bacterium]|nr:hypothetical protein [Clostridiales bacterium]
MAAAKGKRKSSFQLNMPKETPQSGEKPASSSFRGAVDAVVTTTSCLLLKGQCHQFNGKYFSQENLLIEKCPAFSPLSQLRCQLPFQGSQRRGDSRNSLASPERGGGPATAGGGVSVQNGFQKLISMHLFIAKGRPSPSIGNHVHKPFTNLLQTVQHFGRALRYYNISSRNISKNLFSLFLLFSLSFLLGYPAPVSPGRDNLFCAAGKTCRCFLMLPLTFPMPPFKLNIISSELRSAITL